MGQLLSEMNRRAFDIKITTFGIRSHQTIRIPRLEFMCVQFQSFEVADAIIACAGFKVTESHRAKGGVTSGTAAVNRKAVWVTSSSLGQKPCSVDTIIDVYDAPVTVESFAIGAAVTCAAAIINIQHSDAPAGPILDCLLQ